MKNRKYRLAQPVRAGVCVAMSAVLALSVTGCQQTGDDTPEESSSAAEKETLVAADFNPETQYYEAEEAELVGDTYTDSSVSGFSGEGYVDGFVSDGDGVRFTINIEETGFYDLNFRTASKGGAKTNYVYVDDVKVGDVSVDDVTGFQSSYCNRVYLEAGAHEVLFTKSWGWVCLDTLAVSGSEQQVLPDSFYDVSATLVNPNATDNAKRLMSYMTDIYGEYFLSGQNCDDGLYGSEIQAIKLATGGILDGKTPAVLGLDMMEYTPSRVAQGSSGTATEKAIQFWEAGGIVTFCWHWNAPTKYLTGNWYSGFYTDSTNIDLAAIMNGEDEEGYALLMEDIDAIAQQLLILQEADVPVIWRPLHEASGGWFWWGASGAEAYKELYILLYDKLTNEYGLNNLIWLWNGQDADWYPGDEYVDMVGVDIYPGEQVYSSQVNSFLEAVDYSNGNKMVVLSENGCIFDPDLAVRDGAMWGFWCTWGGEFVTVSSGINRLSEQYTEEEMLVKAYESEYVITLDELPDLTAYEIKE